MTTVELLTQKSTGLFVSAAPVVRLVNTFAEPYNNAIATARTCYSSRVISRSDVSKDATARSLRDAIAASTYQAGHHTTLQHATFQFVLENVSRHAIWSFLHAHPFYNSEQVSQRYVAVKQDRVLVPHLPSKALALYQSVVTEQMACYKKLVELLVVPASEAYFNIFPARRKKASDYAGVLKKRSQEVARYALPVATFAHLYHTVSGITLHRYHRLCKMLDVPEETALIVRGMIDAVTAHDPLFFARIEDPISLEETLEYQVLQRFNRVNVNPSARAFVSQFDAQLNGRLSKLIDYGMHSEATLAQAVRSVLGLLPEELSDDQALAQVLSPQHNGYLGNALNLTSLGKLTRTMSHVHYVFRKKLSHTADSQDQRHRTTPGSRPVLSTQYAGGEPDVVIPELLNHSGQALDVFMNTMQRTWQAIDTLLDAGVSSEQALYLLPNAFPVRFEESGDLCGFHHKWVSRLCYNAQEEIWRASIEEVEQVQQVHPRIGKFLGPPCHMRRDAGVRPLCPEGDRFCGIPVWKLKLDEFNRVI